MKILHISYSDKAGGGASIAAFRLHKGFLNRGYISNFWCIKKITNDNSTFRLYNFFGSKFNSLKNQLNQIFFRILDNNLKQSYSLNIWPSRLAKKINTSDFNIVILHWINAETMSCKDIANIKKPVIWVFHDLWPILGIKHYDQSEYINDRFIIQKLESLFIQYKLKHWNKFNPYIVTVGTWLKKEIESSVFFNNSKISVIPNTLDLSKFESKEKIESRKIFNIPINKKMILFGAYDIKDKRKGSDLLEDSLKHIDISLRNSIVVVSFGNGHLDISGFNYINLGNIDNQNKLSSLYSSADIMCVPSRLETFGQTASEALACGVPVVAFETTGLKDIVEHKKTGYLAKAYDSKDFSRGIEWILSQTKIQLKLESRKRAENHFNERKVIDKYIKIFDKIYNNNEVIN